MKAVSELEDAELRNELAAFGMKVGPIAGTTRGFYEKKLEAYRSGNPSAKGAKGSVKRTPSKNNSIVQPVLAPTPLSAKKKSKRSSHSASTVSTESSDNELDLTIADSFSSNSRGGRSSFVNSNKKKDIQPTAYVVNPGISPPRPTVKRTPTPPRASIAKRTPLRESGDSSLNVRGNIFLSDDRNKKSLFNSYDQQDDEDEDDHMESSRIISPSSRFDPFRSSLAGVSRVPQRMAKEDSPVEKVKKFSQNAWSFFSRPVNTSTPCNEVDYKTSPKSLYDKHVSKYNRYSQEKYGPNKFSAPEIPAKRILGNFDVSNWILAILSFVTIVIVVAYFWSAHPETIENALGLLVDLVSKTLKGVYRYAIVPVLLIVLVTGVGYGIYHLLKHRELSKEDRKKRMIELVDRITDIIRDAQADGIAEPYVRDLLMPPTKRSAEDWKLWGEAADFINKEDSRVRTEVRLINGIECNVWVWVPITNNKWQGTAVAEGSPSNSIPSKALTRCIKIRGLIFSDRPSEKIELKRDLRGKLGPVVVPVHVEFSVSQAESIVYMMFRTLDEAKRAFMAFHNNWFNGSLLTAKYVPDKRYLERFPDAGRY